MSVKERHFSNNLISPVVMFRSFERPNLLLKFNQFKAWWIISMHQSYKSECIKLRRIFYRTFNTRSAKSCSKFPRVFWKFVKNCYFLEWKIQKIATLRFDRSCKCYIFCSIVLCKWITRVIYLDTMKTLCFYQQFPKYLLNKIFMK